MNQNDFGKLIKEIRKKNNLTQKELADKYNVTYQAVSKWENGKNMPDVSLIREISKDFNVSLDDMLDGKYSDGRKKKNLLMFIMMILLIIILTIVILFLIIRNNSDFEFKTLSTTCDNFTISGNISYNNNKSAIYITNIEYCGEEDDVVYSSIECTLYESNKNILSYVSSYKQDNVSLKEFLNNVTLSVDNYAKICREYTENSLYLEIDCKNDNGSITSYKVPLSLSDNCN